MAKAVLVVEVIKLMEEALARTMILQPYLVKSHHYNTVITIRIYPCHDIIAMLDLCLCTSSKLDAFFRFVEQSSCLSLYSADIAYKMKPLHYRVV